MTLAQRDAADIVREDERALREFVPEDERNRPDGRCLERSTFLRSSRNRMVT
jgi:hypothetical protein